MSKGGVLLEIHFRHKGNTFLSDCPSTNWAKWSKMTPSRATNEVIPAGHLRNADERNLQRPFKLPGQPRHRKSRPHAEELPGPPPRRLPFHERRRLRGRSLSRGDVSFDLRNGKVPGLQVAARTPRRDSRLDRRPR